MLRSQASIAMLAWLHYSECPRFLQAGPFRLAIMGGDALLVRLWRYQRIFRLMLNCARGWFRSAEACQAGDACQDNGKRADDDARNRAQIMKQRDSEQETKRAAAIFQDHTQAVNLANLVGGQFGLDHHQQGDIGHWSTRRGQRGAKQRYRQDRGTDHEQKATADNQPPQQHYKDPPMN